MLVPIMDVTRSLVNPPLTTAGGARQLPSNFLQANLGALERLNPALVDRIRAAEPCTDIEFVDTPQSVPSIVVSGMQLASRHRPLEEADRWAQTVDIRTHSAIAILGFGAGYHVGALARRLGKSGLMTIFEPDVSLLRSVFERIDHSSWITGSTVMIVTDAEDKAGLAFQMRGSEGIIAQGTTIVPHAPSARRLGEASARFAKTFADLVATMRTTMATTLVHAATTCRNLCLNLDHYSAGAGIADLAGIAQGRPAILVAAGPSLAPQVHLLEDPALRDRAIIIAVQTCLRPLLRRGIKPHFVTALDYHEISAQFYEDLDPDDLREITLLCEAKVNHHVIANYPGPVRVVGNAFLDRLLGPVKRPMGQVTAGSTVAHLSFFAAQHLGCDPIILLGQDLAFTDNLYYGPGAAIHDHWAVELNPFNTIEMMEWARIARMKANLRKGPGHDDREVLLDEQMATYLAQFEREFARAAQTIIDAGSGSLKAHTTSRPFDELFEELVTGPTLPALPIPGRRLNHNRLTRTRRRVIEVRSEATRLIELSRKTIRVLDDMLAKQDQPDAMSRLFRAIDDLRARVDKLSEVYELVTLVNQLGVFKRLRADRQIDLADDLSPLARQRAQLERDQANIQWIIDAATEFVAMLNESLDVLEGQNVDSRINPERVTAGPAKCESDDSADERRRVAAFLWIDPEYNGLFSRRDLKAPFGASPVLETTISRLCRCKEIESVVLLVPSDCDFTLDFDVDAFARPVIVQSVHGPVCDEPRRARAAARRWSESSWRGGIGGMSVYDEIIVPEPMNAAMESLGLDAVVVVAPDWPLVDPSPITGCDALVRRYREQPEVHRLVFSQAPPGLCGCLIARSLMNDMATNARQYTVGAMLSYIPSIPQLDPIGKDTCIKLPAAIRTDPGRYTMDAPDRIAHLTSCVAADPDLMNKTGLDLINAISIRQVPISTTTRALRHVQIDITTRRHLQFGPSPIDDAVDTPPSDLARLFKAVAATGAALTIGIDGDPLLAPEFGRIIHEAHEAGIRAIQVCTDLLGDVEIDGLLALPIDVFTINVLSDSAESYQALSGSGRFDEILGHIERLINAKNQITNSANTLQRPWIVPRMWRHALTLSEQQNFVDRWLHYVGAALVSPTPHSTDEANSRPLMALPTPPSAQWRFDREALAVDHLGFVRGMDRSAPTNVFVSSLPDVWAQVIRRRFSPTSAAQADEEPILATAAA